MSKVIETPSGEKIYHLPPQEHAIKTPRGRRSDCSGYCIVCKQAKVEVRTESEGSKNKPLQNVLLYFCNLPMLHTVTFPRPRGRGHRPPQSMGEKANV